MDLPPQRNFYDDKRYFQGKDNPGDSHPPPSDAPPPLGQIAFGVIFLVVLVLLFLANTRGEEQPPAHGKAPPVAAAPIKR